MAKNEAEGAATAAAQTQHPIDHAAAAARHPAAPQPEPAKAERKPPKPIGERYFQMREVRQTEWFATVNADVTPEDCLKREFWSEVFPKVSFGSIIAVFPEDRSWYGEMVVFGKGIGWVEARWIVGPVKAPASVLNYSAFSDYEVRELGEIKKWSVILRADGRVMHHGENSQADAARWLSEYVRTQMGRAA